MRSTVTRTSQAHRPAPQAGFTLLEVLMSGVVLSLVLLGAAGVMNGVANGTRNAQGNTFAAEALQSKIEELRSLPFRHADLTAGAHELQSGPLARRLRWTVTDDVADELKRVDLSVTWTERRATRQLGMRIHIANRSLQ